MYSLPSVHQKTLAEVTTQTHEASLCALDRLQQRTRFGLVAARAPLSQKTETKKTNQSEFHSRVRAVSTYDNFTDVLHCIYTNIDKMSLST